MKKSDFCCSNKRACGGLTTHARLPFISWAIEYDTLHIVPIFGLMLMVIFNIRCETHI